MWVLLGLFSVAWLFVLQDMLIEECYSDVGMQHPWCNVRIN